MIVDYSNSGLCQKIRLGLFFQTYYSDFYLSFFDRFIQESADINSAFLLLILKF